jgi:adenylate kinase
LLELRCKSGAPRRPPRIIIAGPPGSGKYTQSKILSEAYGIVHVSVNELLKKEISTNRELGKSISAALDAGEPVPDHIVNRIIENRLNETDCRVNGWILEGFPKSKP